MKSNPKSANFKYSWPMARGIDVTVAAIIERDGKFLMVEERAGGTLVLNQPAGHLEQGESLFAAAAREALEETGHRFEPEHVVGFYLWRSEDADTTYLRVAFCGDVEPSADVAAARSTTASSPCTGCRAPNSSDALISSAARWCFAASTITSRANVTRSIA